MNLIRRIYLWEQARHQSFILLLRVLLGLVILIKGIFFLHVVTGASSWSLNNAGSLFGALFWGYFVSFTGITCGMFISTGLFTRAAILLQIFFLTGGAVFVNPDECLHALNAASALSLVMVSLLFYLLLQGPGKISMDNYMHLHEY